MSPSIAIDDEETLGLNSIAKVMDPVQKAMGSMGRWHILVCATIFLLKFPVAWHQMSIIFLAPPVNYICANNSTAAVCSAECVKEYDRSIFTETIITTWDLVCDRKHLANMSQTIFMLGILFGNMIFGYLADRYGRRNPLVVAVIIQMITGVATSFVNEFWLFCVLRFICALATGGTMVTSFVIIMEIIGTKWRELISVLYQIPFNLGHLTLPGFAYFIRDWRYYQLALSAPSVILISYYWLVPESPRWLLAVGRTDNAVTILEKAAKSNKLPTENIRTEMEAYSAEQKGSEQHKGTFFDLVRTPNMRAKTFYIGFNWLVCGLVFFGVSQYVGQTGGDIFSNVAISASLELPGTILCIYLMKNWGRRYTLIASNTLAGVACLLIAVVPPDSFWAIVSLASAGTVGMSISFPTVYLYAGELFPTVVRNIGIGSCSMIARIGSMVAPFVVGLSSTQHSLPPVIFGIIPLIGAALCFMLPETIGCDLPVTIEDGENFGKKVQIEKNVTNVENGQTIKALEA